MNNGWCHSCVPLLTGIFLVSSIHGRQQLSQVQAAQDQNAATSDQKQGVLPQCDRDRALNLVRGQVDEAKAIDSARVRIGILIKVADSLWRLQRDAARAIFNQAYEWACKDFQENSGKQGQLQDLRFLVIQAISRVDPAWARVLAKGLADEARKEAETAAAQTQQVLQKGGDQSSVRDNLLMLASSILDADRKSALDLARSALQYPGTYALPQFAYRVAGSDQGMGDQFYIQAVKAYATSNIRSLLMLSAYPFGSSRIVIGAEAITLSVPSTFSPDYSLQQIFLDALFHRVEAILNLPESRSTQKEQQPELSQIYVSLSALEPLIAEYQPSLLEKASLLRITSGNLLSSPFRQSADSTVGRQLGKNYESFASYVDQAEKAGSSGKGDYFLVVAVVTGADDESLDRLKDLARKVTNSTIRQQLLDWLYFKRSQKAIKAGLLDDAKQLADKVEQLALRAYLSYEVAAESMKRFDDKVRAGEALNSVSTAALKADNTNEKARTLLGLSILYSKVDQQHSFETMADAVKTVNHIATPDLGGTSLFAKIEGAQFAYYAKYEVAGFSLENSFRELARFDFDRALGLAQTLDDKSLRSMAVIAVAASCLERNEAQEKASVPTKQNDPNQQTLKSSDPGRKAQKPW